MQHMKGIALMHRILTTPVPKNYLYLLHYTCRLSRKCLISVLEFKSLVLVLVLARSVLSLSLFLSLESLLASLVRVTCGRQPATLEA